MPDTTGVVGTIIVTVPTLDATTLGVAVPFLGMDTRNTTVTSGISVDQTSIPVVAVQLKFVELTLIVHR